MVVPHYVNDPSSGLSLDGHATFYITVALGTDDDSQGSICSRIHTASTYPSPCRPHSVETTKLGNDRYKVGDDG